MTFKVGDRVLTKTTDLKYSGLRGTVVEKKGYDAVDDYRVKCDNFEEDWPIVFSEDELEINPECQEPGSGYYDFPGGVEVRQISAHLTGFGAQAFQYVARATRLDGKNKGDVVSDLNKAIDFICWEIERIENARNGN